VLARLPDLAGQGQQPAVGAYSPEKCGKSATGRGFSAPSGMLNEFPTH
jgi:hypothetical protein